MIKSKGMRWNCKLDGCFNDKKRLKLEKFDECFPGKINFTDIDALVEINGYFCLLEWKGLGSTLTLGQEIMVKQFTKSRGNLVVAIEGDAEVMSVDRYLIYWNGRADKWTAGNLNDVKRRLRGWVAWARTRPRRIA